MPGEKIVPQILKPSIFGINIPKPSHKAPHLRAGNPEPRSPPARNGFPKTRKNPAAFRDESAKRSEAKRPVAEATILGEELASSVK
jgi:hypothetical protein